MIKPIAGMTLLAFAAVALPAAAQLSSEGGPIQVDADNGEILDREKKAIYYGNVDVIQGDARLRADRIEVIYAGGGEGGGIGGSFGALTRIVARGDVFYVTPDFKARGEVGVYNAENGTITLRGNVVVNQGNDVAQGEQLVLYIEDGRSVLSAGEDGRVRTVLVPDEAETQD
jgi:lipopolysaccharide export system protein LptA